jgi:hypothetical protein
MYPTTAGLYLVNWFTFKSCFLINSSIPFNSSFNNSHYIERNFNYTILSNSSSKIEKENCIIKFDPFYILSGIFLVLGLVYYLIFRKMIKRLNNLNKSEWKIKIIN